MAGSISYTPQFSHKDWIDFVDSIQAGGPNGINIRMRGIAAEFQALSQVITQINSSLVIPPPIVTQSYAPSFFPNLTDPPWVQNNGLATKGPSQTAADGWLPLQLPDGTQLQSMTILGTKSGNVGSFQMQLVKQPLSGGGVTTLLAIPLADQPDTIQVTGQVPSNLALVDNANNKYLVIARIVGADATSSASLNVIQIVTKRS
jgi:hypothetical protein